jgi:hypothetical protein
MGRGEGASVAEPTPADEQQNEVTVVDDEKLEVRRKAIRGLFVSQRGRRRFHGECSRKALAKFHVPDSAFEPSNGGYSGWPTFAYCGWGSQAVPPAQKQELVDEFRKRHPMVRPNENAVPRLHECSSSCCGPDVSQCPLAGQLEMVFTKSVPKGTLIPWCCNISHASEHIEAEGCSRSGVYDVKIPGGWLMMPDLDTAAPYANDPFGSDRSAKNKRLKSNMQNLKFHLCKDPHGRLFLFYQLMRDVVCGEVGWVDYGDVYWTSWRENSNALSRQSRKARALFDGKRTIDLSTTDTEDAVDGDEALPRQNRRDFFRDKWYGIGKPILARWGDKWEPATVASIDVALVDDAAESGSESSMRPHAFTIRWAEDQSRTVEWPPDHVKRYPVPESDLATILESFPRGSELHDSGEAVLCDICDGEILSDVPRYQSLENNWDCCEVCYDKRVHKQSWRSLVSQALKSSDIIKVATKFKLNVREERRLRKNLEKKQSDLSKEMFSPSSAGKAEVMSRLASDVADAQERYACAQKATSRFVDSLIKNAREEIVPYEALWDDEDDDAKFSAPKQCAGLSSFGNDPKKIISEFDAAKAGPKVPPTAAALLKAWILRPENFSNPIPTNAQKTRLSQEAGITLQQLNIWLDYAQKLQRDWRQLRALASWLGLATDVVAFPAREAPLASRKRPKVMREMGSKRQTCHTETPASKRGRVSSCVQAGISPHKSSPKKRSPSRSPGPRASKGDSSSGNLPRKVVKDIPREGVKMLKRWMLSDEHFHHPYPNNEEKMQLVNATGITLKQLNNWFTNARRRLWRPLFEKRERECAASAGCKRPKITAGAKRKREMGSSKLKLKKLSKSKLSAKSTILVPELEIAGQKASLQASENSETQLATVVEEIVESIDHNGSDIDDTGPQTNEAVVTASNAACVTDKVEAPADAPPRLPVDPRIAAIRAQQQQILMRMNPQQRAMFQQQVKQMQTMYAQQQTALHAVLAGGQPVVAPP